jgi:hypothetical protein
MPSPFEMGRAVGGNISGAFQSSQETSALDNILQQAMQSNDPQVQNDVMRQILTRVSPEKQEMALKVLQQRTQQMQQQRQRQAYSERGLSPDLPESINKEMLRQKADESLWKEAIARRAQNLGQPSQNIQDASSSSELGVASQEEGLRSPAMEQPTSLPSVVKPIYASSSVDPKYFRKDISKYETARLAEADKGYKRNEKYLTTTQEQAETQPFIQDSIRQALVDVQSGNVSGALATMRAKLAQAFPSVLSAQEKNFENAMKNIALEQFASTPGFRSQGEFFVLQKVLPNLGDRKKSQELNLKAILDSSLMKSKEEEVILDILNQSPDGEVPLNLREIVKDRMDNEWKKLYARRYAEDPKIWDEYLNSPAGKNDPLFKDIKNTPVPQSSIDWDKYVKMINPEGKKVAVHKAQAQEKLAEGYKEI